MVVCSVDDNVVRSVSTARISTVLRGLDEALLTVTGGVDVIAASRVAVVLGALLQAGARRLLIDLSHADVLDPSLEVLLDREARRVRAAGGWLVVDHAPAYSWGEHSSLSEVFEIYRQACTGDGAPTHGRARPVPSGREPAGRPAGSAVSGRGQLTASAAARPAWRPENRQPPRKVPSSDR